MLDKDQNNETEDYEGRIKKHRFRTRFIVIGLIAVAIVTTATVMINKYRSGYGHYVALNSLMYEESDNASYVPFDGGYIRYSRDGASMVTYAGEQRWNRTYQMDNPVIDVCGKYAVVANIKGTDYFLFDASGYVASVNTAMPIISAKVSSQGLVCVVLEGDGATYISMFDKEANRVYSIKSTIEGDGVPVSIDVSPNGEMLMVAYTALNSQELATSVVFYSFNEVGQNEAERIVAGYDTYGDGLISRVVFLSETSAVAIGERVISFFKITEYPKLAADVAVNGTIRQVFYSSKYVGMTVADENQKESVLVYDRSGNLKYQAPTEASYNRYALCDSGIMMYNDSQAQLVTFTGRKMYSGEILEGTSAVFSLSGNDEYLIIGGNKIERIKMKHGN